MESITERMRQVMERKGLNAKGFAELLGIQRSGLSHIYSGRNKPGLDLIQKILEVFPEVSAGWLLTGTGDPEIKSVAGIDATAHLFDDKPDPEEGVDITSVTPSAETKSDYNVKPPVVPTPVLDPTGEEMELPKVNHPVSRLILLNENGTFTLYTKA